MEKNDGNVPTTVKELLKLNGIGRYMANAILIFSLGEKGVLVDANITRLLQRLFNLPSKKDNRRDKIFWELMEKLTPTKSIKQFYWAILDFTALVCKPGKPDCENCFLQPECYFFIKNKKEFQSNPG